MFAHHLFENLKYECVVFWDLFHTRMYTMYCERASCMIVYLDLYAGEFLRYKRFYQVLLCWNGSFTSFALDNKCMFNECLFANYFQWELSAEIKLIHK